MAVRVIPAVVAACALALAGSGAAAQKLYGYVDGRGVAHVSDRALDSRYEPLIRESGDATGRVPGKAMERSSLMTWLEFAPEVKALQPTLREAEQLTGVDAELLKAVITVESGFKPTRVSPAGAIGLMQITPQTGDRYGSKAERAAAPASERLLDPRINVLTGARMLADLIRRFGGIDAALAAWNAGEGRVRRAGNKVPDIAETRAHVHLVLELYWSLLQQRQQRQAHELNLVHTDLNAAGSSAP